ncbi:MAG TPA: hypothetical protein VFW07_17095 [Parafilimonas sp.]|nr:hypothetical protein [Parafilimonas sp.]
MNEELILGVDIGGSHICTAVVDLADGSMKKESFCKEKVDAQEVSEVIFDQWAKACQR